MDARFGTLRAVGALLVSADLKSGAVFGIKIVAQGAPSVFCTSQVLENLS
jgi:hypothetical protein